METLNIQKTDNADSFQQDLMEAILATFTATQDTEKFDIDAAKPLIALSGNKDGINQSCNGKKS